MSVEGDRGSIFVCIVLRSSGVLEALGAPAERHYCLYHL